MKNENLTKAKKTKNDEFYTQYIDIERECQHYVDQFNGQWIYLPCDSEESNFWKYFVDHFKEYGLKRLTATHINLDGTSSYRLDYDGTETIKTPMEGNGGFNTPEGIALIQEADIIVTNPPFSLFREFIALLMEYDKKFLILGNMNAITYKEVFPLIKDNQIWAGCKCFGGGMNMIQPEDTFDESKTKSFTINDKGEIIKNIMGVIWFTNLDHQKRHEPLDLYKKYNPEEFPKYDNYNAIEVSKVCDIPEDYKGIMGVPISFLDKYCPEQFEILDARDYALNERQKNKNTYLIKDADGAINGKPTYARILIKSK